MPRKPRQRRRDPHDYTDGMNQGHHSSPQILHDKIINVRKINPSDEGVLYTMQITPKRPHKHKSSFLNWGKFGKRKSQLQGPQTNTLWGQPSRTGAGVNQFTITKKKRYKNPILNWIDSHDLNPFNFAHNDVDTHLYRPSNLLYRYIDWTFHASFTSVFISFLFYYFVITLVFGLFLLVAGNAQPECITSAGEHFGANPSSKMNDAYHLSWTTFTTVGYGNGYTSTANDLVAEDGTTRAHECSLVVLVCNAEAFIGLLYAGMCAAILFGKVNRVQSHAKLVFANAVCLQYEEIEEDGYDTETVPSGFKWESGEIKDGMMVKIAPRVTPQSPMTLDHSPDEKKVEELPVSLTESALELTPMTPSKAEQFVDQYNGCPILKFQVVNEMCNREGSEIVDAVMKVVGVKFKGHGGQITQSQLVRVNLVDFEHPFFSRVWHGVHILDATSPLLTDRAKRRIEANDGSWPTEWFDPEIIKKQLEFNDLVVTVAGISNISALTVHAYKRYKIGDVLIGFNFAPLVFRDGTTGNLEVDLSLCHDVREQQGGGCEDLMESRNRLKRAESTIRITKSKDSDFLEVMESQPPAIVEQVANGAENEV